jgi:hypothetical protein
VTGHGFKALAGLRFEPRDSDAILFVRRHGFSLGIERSASGRELEYFGPLAWFERRDALRRAAPSPSRFVGQPPALRVRI